jgi:hypothetical protein
MSPGLSATGVPASEENVESRAKRLVINELMVGRIGWGVARRGSTPPIFGRICRIWEVAGCGALGLWGYEAMAESMVRVAPVCWIECEEETDVDHF